MLPLIIAGVAGLAGLIGGVVVFAYWDEIVSWLKNLVSKVKEAFVKAHSHVKYAMGVFARTIKKGIVRIIHSIFYRENDKWMKQTTESEVPASEVPEWVKAKVEGNTNEHDISNDADNKLDLQLNV